MTKKALVSGLMVLGLLLQPLTAMGAFAKILPIFPSGQLNVSLSPATRVAGNIQAGTNGAELATFDLTAVNENILVRKIAIQIGGTVNVRSITNGRLVDNQGRVLFGPSLNGNGMGLFTFAGNINVPKNSRLSMKFLVDVNQNAINGTTVRASIPSAVSFLAIGGVSGNRIQPNGRFPVTGRTMTIVNVPVVQVGSLTVTNNASLSPFSTVIAGSRNVNLMKINLTASNTEDVELRSLTVKIDGVGQNDLPIVKFVRDSTGQTIYTAAVFNANPEVGGNLAQYFTIRRGTTEVITVQADISRVVWNYNFVTLVERAANVSAIGLFSAEQVQILGNFPVVGPQISVINNGTLTVAASPLVVGQNITVGMDRTLAAFDFTASNEDVQIRELKLNFAGNPALVPWVKIVKQDTNELIYQGSIVADQLDAVFFNANLVVPKDGRLTLLVRADVTDQFINPGDNNRSMSFNIQSADDIEAMGVMSGMILDAQGNFPILGPVMILPAPAVADNDLRVSLSAAQLGRRLVAGINTLAAFDLSSGSEPLQVRNLKVKLASNNFANIRNVTFVVKSGMDEQVVYSGVPTVLGGNMAGVRSALSTDIGENSTKTLLVRAEIVMVNMGDAVQVQIERAEDISAVGMISGEFVDIQGAFPLMAGVQTF